MKKSFVFLAAVSAIFLLAVACNNAASGGSPPTSSVSSAPVSASGAPATAIVPSKPFVAPLSDLANRQIKIYFGIYVTPQNSPIQPEHFTGYHTGTDFEIFPQELNAVVPVYAICDGKLLVRETATGYGGVAVELCTLNSQPVTVVYGHIKLSSVSATVGSQLKAGQQIAVLGAAYSAETGGERKHLHLDIHKGSAVNILGYVQNKSDLSQWIDPTTVIQE